MQNDIGYHLPAAIFIHQDVSFVICQRLLNVIVNSQAQSLAVEQVHQRKFSPIALHLISPLHDIRQTRSRGIYLGSLLGHRLQLFRKRSRIFGRFIIRFINSQL